MPRRRRFSRRQLRALGVVSFLLITIVTPAAMVYALDFRLVEKPASGISEEQAVPYESLPPEQRAAIDAALAGDGPWYRSIGESPFESNLIVVERNGTLHALTFEEQYHWGSWRGRLPPVTLGIGVVAGAVALFDIIQSPSRLTG